MTINLAHTGVKELPEGIPPRNPPLSTALATLVQVIRGISSSLLLTCSLSEGFGQLESLKVLNLEGLNNLVALPEGTPAHIPSSASSELHMNYHWDISTSILLNRSLSEGFGKLRRLVELNLGGCRQLRALPEGIPPRILPLSAALAILT